MPIKTPRHILIKILINGLLLLILALQSTVVFPQQPNPYKIKSAKSLFGDRCRDYHQVLKKMPGDVRYGVKVEERVIYLIIPSLAHFHQLFGGANDGFAIDIVQLSQYNCGEDTKLRYLWPNRGLMLPPMYKNEMEAVMYQDALNNVIVPYHAVPEHLNPAEIECNILVLQKRALCDYNVILNMEFGNWDLLEMGLYGDSIPRDNGVSEVKSFQKTIEFSVPFERNKTTFLASDIRPLYDSLNLSGFEIREISILASTSVEGPTELNEELQRGRAQSIIDALQAYQSHEIKTTIYTNENWPLFARDISGTKFEYLKSYPKEKIKELLSTDKALLNELEPLLAKQRQGKIRLLLHKKWSIEQNDPVELKSVFQLSLEEKNLAHAITLQQIIFDRIREERLPDEFINQLEIPRESAYGPLFNNIVLFNFERQNLQLYEAIAQLEELHKLNPASSKLNYNLAALKIRVWAEGNTASINRHSIDKLIKNVSGKEIHPTLIDRLKINYYLLLTQHLTLEKKFAEKRRTVKYIYFHYKNLRLDDDEVLSLARFLAFNSEFDLAKQVLYPKVTADVVSEELLFYFLKLTIGNPKNTQEAEYSDFLAKAIHLNKVRYCELYAPKPQGGATFQLKEYKILKDSFCATCE